MLSNVLTDLTDMLTGTCTVERAVETGVDAIGNIGKTWQTLITCVPCSVQPAVSSSRWDESKQAQLSVYDYEIYLVRTSDYTPTHKDRITTHKVNGFTDPNIYEIEAVLDDGGRAHHWFIGAKVVST